MTLGGTKNNDLLKVEALFSLEKRKAEKFKTRLGVILENEITS